MVTKTTYVTCYEQKGPLGINFYFSKMAKSKSQFFLLLSLSENLYFWLHIDILSLCNSIKKCNYGRN